ncbi:MAG: hypothetical protein IIB77_06900 [Proteobacteria bacterium]|nr:hypothetical protein [Pseudomonadota bacterium]
MLTKRERWLMEAAFLEGWQHRHGTEIKGPITKTFGRWLNMDAADGVTVESVLEKDAPDHDEKTTGE